MRAKVTEMARGRLLDVVRIFSWGIPATAQTPKGIYCTSCKTGYRRMFYSCEKTDIRLLEDVWGNYGLLTQSLKTGSVVLKKKEAWMRIAESVNAVGGQGRAVSAIQKCWKGMRLSQRQQLTWLVDLRRHLYRTRTLFSLSWVKTAIISMGLSSVSAVLISSTSFCPHQLV